MSVAVLTTVYSSKSNVIFPSVRGKLVVYSGGVSLRSTGGMVSFGPPPGGVVVLAQECEKIQHAASMQIRNMTVALSLMLMTC